MIVVGAGLAGLVATAELAEAGRRVLLLDQEPESQPGRSGVLVVRRAVPRRLPASSAGWASRTPASWPGRTGWAAPASTAASTTRPARTTGRTSGRRPTSTSPPGRSGPGCTSMGVRWFPIVGWAERGGDLADGHGNSVPRFHVTWGTGPAVVEPFERRVRDGGGERAWSSFSSGTGSTS